MDAQSSAGSDLILILPNNEAQGAWRKISLSPTGILGLP